MKCQTKLGGSRNGMVMGLCRESFHTLSLLCSETASGRFLIVTISLMHSIPVSAHVSIVSFCIIVQTAELIPVHKWTSSWNADSAIVVE